MATYKGIKGFSIQNLSADPSNPIEGEMWYNSTSNVWKVEELTTAGTFATGNNMNNSNYFVGSAGTQTAALAFGSANPGSNGLTESYNGTSWTTQPTFSPRNGVAGGGALGTQTATLVIGAIPAVTSVESWSGSTWSPSPSLNTGRGNSGVAGTQTAALVFGGRTPDSTATESFNGTTWTSVNSMNTGRWAIGSFGTQTAAIGVGGNTGSTTAATESWDGTSWTTVNASNTNIGGRSGAGIQTLGLAMGGQFTSATELYDGTSWTSNPTGLSTARGYAGSGGTQASAIIFGGYVPAGGGSLTNATEEWTGAGVAVTKTITVS
jgi:hypothetical protein